MLSSGPVRGLPRNTAGNVELRIDDDFRRSDSPRTAPSLNTPQQEQVSSVRRIAFYAAVAMIFARMSVTPEILAYLTGTNTYVLYLVGPLALIGVLVSGGIGRAFRSKVSWYWTGLVICMLIATPVSSWPGGSAQLVSTYLRTDYICLLVLAGTVSTWKDIKTVFNMLVASGFIVLCVVRFLATPDNEGRLALDVTDSTIGNPNDLAAHVLLLLPFMCISDLRPGRIRYFGLLALGGGFYSVWIILGTSSRGAFIALASNGGLPFLQSHRQRSGLP